MEVVFHIQDIVSHLEFNDVNIPSSLLKYSSIT